MSAEERNECRKSDLGDSDNETRDEEDNVSGSGSGNSSGSESDGDSGSDTSGGGNSSGNEQGSQKSEASSDEDEEEDGNEENASPSKRSTTSSKTTTSTTVAGGSPPNQQKEEEEETLDNSKTNGYSDDENSDSGSNSGSSSSDSEDSGGGGEQDASNTNVHNASNTSTTTTTTATNTTTTSATSNTSNAANDLEREGSDNEAASNDDSNDENEEEERENENINDRSQTAIDTNPTLNAHASDDDAESDGESEKSSSTGDDDEEDEEEPESPTESSSEEEEEDDYQPKRSTRQVRKPPPSQDKPKKVLKKKRKQTWESDVSDDSDKDSAESTPPRRKASVNKSKQKPQQQQHRSGGSRKKRANDSDESEDEAKRSGTRRAGAAVSYKEASEDEKTGSEDLLEYDYDETQAEASNAAMEEEDKAETIERVLAKRMGKKGCTGNQTTIYALVENESHERNNEIMNVDDQDSDNMEVQYLIKWKGWSYIHNTWESENTLRDQKAKGIKKLENFIKKEQDIEHWRRYAGPEDIDYFECQLELQNELLKSYNNVDRIIACNDKDDGTREYLCKWQSLPYAESTWEDASLVVEKWQQCVEQFDERENSKCTPSRQSKVLRHRPKFYRIKDQLEFVADCGLILRDYQLDGLNWLLHSWCKDNSVILADEMGLGKTIQTICFLYALFKLHHLYGPFLCVVPLSTMTAWQREFQLWAPDLNVVTYLGDVKSRELIRQFEWQFDGSKRLKFNCILTTYEIVLKDKLFLGTLQWAALLVDEAHRLKNDDSLLYKSLKEFETNHRLLITGTPLQNSLKELWALLHFIMPEKFVTWEEFEKEHGNAADKGYTKLHQQLEPYILRRVKKDVEKSLPAKVEQILRVEMTSMQKTYYKWILTKNFDALRKGKRGSTSTFLNIVIELKKCCNHAALIRPSEFELIGLQQEEALKTLLKGSGKLVLLDKLLCRLRDTGHRVLIFSQMVRMLDILADYLQKRHFPFQRLDGSIKGEMRRQALDHFNADGSQDFCFLLSTRAGGLGINLATADTVIIFDSDWNPQNDLQAQARAHRIGQKNQVNIYRLVTARSVEEQIVERAKQKMVLDHLVIQRMDTTGRTVLDKSGGGSSTNSNPFDKDDLSAILKFGAEELFKDEQENEENELVCDIDEILRRAETRNEDPEMPGDDLLSAFKVASIMAFEEEPGTEGDPSTKTTQSPNVDGGEDDTKDWDDIIPENFRKIVEEKERAKEMEDLYLPPRRKTTANNQTDTTPSKRGKKCNQNDSGDSDYEIGSDASGDGADGRAKKQRGRPAMKEKISGFTDAEIRRFIRSYRKFPAPLLRLEAIACDAELQEKPLAELKRIGELLHDRCVQFIEEHKDDPPPPTKAAAAATAAAATAAAIVSSTNGGDENAASKQKRVRATYSIKLGGVSFNAKTLLSCEEELKPLNEIIPNSANDRLNWLLDAKTRPANFDTEWGIEEDSKLLCGIYQYGIGSWEQMKMDPSLLLTDKILFNDTRKPQAKHLQSRAEYLLKIIKKNVELKKGAQRRQRKPRKTKDSKGGNAFASGNGTPESRTRKFSDSYGMEAEQQQQQQGCGGAMSSEGGGVRMELEHDGIDLEASGSVKKKRRSGGAAANSSANAGGGGKAGKAKKSNKPMHFTANNEPRALDVLGDLDPSIFNECKEKMRPVKRALKALDRPDSSLTNQEQVKQTRECLLAIGKQIDSCLETYNDADKKIWRSNLWYFVSKFTEFDAKKLFKLYKNMLKEKSAKSSADSSKSPTKSTSSSPQKKSKDGGGGGKTNKEQRRMPNGLTIGGKDIEKDKEKSSSKKKKKDKDRNMDGGLSLTADERFGEVKKLQRMDGSLQGHKRKHDDSITDNNTDDGMSYKRMNADARSRDRNNDRNRHNRDDYYGSGNSHDSFNGRNERRSNLNTPSSAGNSRGERRLPPTGIGGSNFATASGSSSSGGGDARKFIDNGNERWSGHGRDRYGNSEYKRDRYDSYNSRSGGGSSTAGSYQQHRGNRDRRPEKRRYPPALPPHAVNYSGHYPMPPNFFLPNGVLPPGNLPPAHVAAGGMYRGDMRYPHGPSDWTGRESRMEYSPEYRRGASSAAGGTGGDYDRRQQT